MRVVLLCVAFILAVNVPSVFSVTEIKECKNPPAVQAVWDITGCEKPPCLCKKLTTAHADITFTPDQDYEKVTIVLEGTVMGVTHGFPGIHGNDACNNLYTNPGKVKAGCPLKAGQEYVYSVDLPIEKHFIKITVTTRWALTDKKTKKDVICANIPLKIA